MTMAYLDFAAIDGAPAMTALRAPALPVEEFTQLEWTVIELARQDKLASLRPPSRFAESLARLLGRAIPRPLADTRLESLRRFAVHAWHHGYVLPAPELTKFLTAGFSPEQAETLIGHAIFASVKPDRKTVA